MIMEHHDNGDSEYTLSKVKVFVGAEDSHGSTVKMGNLFTFEISKINKLTSDNTHEIVIDGCVKEFKTKWDAVDFILESLGR